MRAYAIRFLVEDGFKVCLETVREYPAHALNAAYSIFGKDKVDAGLKIGSFSYIELELTCRQSIAD